MLCMENVNDLASLIPFAAACKMLPSSRPGKKLHLATLHRWRLAGRFEAVRLGSMWYIHRSELARLAQPWRAPPPIPPVKVKPKKMDPWTEEVLKRAGI